MRGLRPIVCLVCGIASVALADDLLKFRNGDQLHGTVISATASNLQWQTTSAPQPIEFETTNLVELQLAPRPPKTDRQLHGWLVTLANGVKLTGDIVALDAQTLTLTTWYAGRLMINRTAVQHVESRAVTSAVIYTGPAGLSDWKIGQPGWTYQRGKFYCARGRYATIGKDVGLPAVASIEFDIAWRGQSYWGVGFYTTDGFNLGTGGYLLSCNGNYLNLNRSGDGNQRNLDGNVQVPQFQTRSQAHVAIRVNEPKKTIAVFIDHVLVKQWTDPGEFAGKGRALFFQSQGQTELRVANILVSEWDGKLDNDFSRPPAATDDLVRLTNGDKVSGRLHAITGGEAMLTTSFADVRIPLTRISAIDLAGLSAASTNQNAADVRAYFPDGTQFTVTLGQLDDQGLAGTTENCGRVLLPLDTFTRLRFHIYDKSADTDDDDEWGAVPTSSQNRGRQRRLLN